MLNTEIDIAWPGIKKSRTVVATAGVWFDKAPAIDNDFWQGYWDNKQHCPWCQGYTKDDQYGHCGACGGPRDEPN